MSDIRETRVDRLQPGDVVTGTAASGDFDDGPRIVFARVKARAEHSVRMTAWEVHWRDEERLNIYYGDTLVTVQRLGTDLAAAGGLPPNVADDVARHAVSTFGLGANR